jgi:diguanylate cyclase (GGDEF)-like protein
MEPREGSSFPTARQFPLKTQQWRFLRKEFRWILVWPFLAILLVWVLWSLVTAKLDQARETVRQEAFKQASSISRAYAEQVIHTLERVDQITLGLKYVWEDIGAVPDLEKQKEKGLYPESAMLFANIIDRSGNILTSTFSSESRPNVAHLPYFQEHQSGHARGLLITGPRLGLRSQRLTVWFSRSLEKPDGAFDGVAVVAVEPSFLTAFRDESLLGQGDQVAVRFIKGPILAIKTASNPPQDFYLNPPEFPLAAGVMEEPAEKFVDKEPRVVAWQNIEQYSLVTVAMLSEKEIFAPYAASARAYRGMARAASVLILLFALTGMILSFRLAWRRQQAEDLKFTYHVATDAANEGFYILKPLYSGDEAYSDFRFEDCNERGAAMLGAPRDGIIGHAVSELFAGAARRDLLAVLRRAMDIGLYEDEFRVSQPSRFKAAWIYRRLVRTNAGLALTMRDTSQEKAHEQALATLANTDALTALPNRHWLTNYLPAAVGHARKQEARLAILFIDLDDFKNINDTLGHDAGDELLKQAALRLRKTVRASDHVVRLGGDEFMIILEQVDAMEDVSRVARFIVKTIAEPYTLAGREGNHVHASIGISMFPQDGNDGDTLVRHADVAMYAAKAAGKGRYRFYQSHLSDNLVLKLNKEQALRMAIERDEFMLHYQPRVGAHSGQLFGMEALVRWARPGSAAGLVHATEFIDIAEDAGLILKLDELVIDKACAQLAQWAAHGLAVVPVAVNISARQIKEGKLSALLSRTIERHGIAAALLEIELDETAMMEKNQALSDELAAIRSLGVKIVVDNFGTGQSSLAQLQSLKVDILKVDCRLTHALDGGKEELALFQAIVSMANALGICVAAEGVENAGQLALLQSLPCDEVQGYFVARPAPAGDIPALLQKRFLFPPSFPRSPVPVT